MSGPAGNPAVARRLFPARALAALFCVTLVTGCGRSGDGPASTAPAPVGSTTRYDWYMEARTPAGQTTIVQTGDGRVTDRSFVHWNNREYTLNSELQLDDEGFVTSQRISGTGPFGAAIDETFRYANGVATWQTAGASGSAQTDEMAFYLPNESLALGSFGALVRLAATRLDNEVPLFPQGSARVEKLTEVEVPASGTPQILSLYAVSGPGFTPSYAWFSGDMQLAAIDSDGYLGMIPEGWRPETLATLSAVQSAEQARYVERMSAQLSERIDGALIFDNVNVVDVETGSLLANHFVRIAAGKIDAVSPRPIEDPGATRIDGTGRFLIPGLWDMHGHFGLSDGVLNIAGGITSVRDIGGVHEKVMDLTAKIDAGVVIGPHTYRAGFIDKAGPYASGWAAESLDEALERVDFFADNGYLQIKLYSSVEPGWVRPIAERAHSHGMRLSGHIPAFMSAEQAVRAGYDEIQHINMVFLNFLAGDREDTRKQLRFTLYGDEAGNLDLGSREVRAFIELLKENDVVVDATAAIFETQLTHTRGEPDPTFAAVIDHLPPSVARPMHSPDMEMGEMAEAWRRSSVKQAAMLKALYDAGVQLVAGSDHLPAFTLHRELEVYAEAGIPAAAVLRIATLDSARVIGVADRTGSIAAGKDSDLVLLDRNPLEDIAAVRGASLVVKGNTLYRPDRLFRAVGVKPFVQSVNVTGAEDRQEPL